jgi:predicted transposase YdaD
VWKLRLIRQLYEAGYNQEQIINLFNFLDWVLVLPKQLEAEFWTELKAYEEERQMPYITTGERIGYDRGKEEGQEEGARSLILRLLTRKVGTVSDHEIDRIQALSIDQLETLGEALLNFGSIEDLTAWLDSAG